MIDRRLCILGLVLLASHNAVAAGPADESPTAWHAGALPDRQIRPKNRRCRHKRHRYSRTPGGRGVTSRHELESRKARGPL